MDLQLSVILPAFNEAHRLPCFLPSVREHLSENYPGRHEVIIVDDGSRDDTSQVLTPLQAEWCELTVLRHPVNRGKGAAVRTGMLAARGELLLYADADGATPIGEERKLTSAIEAGADVAVGSRLLDEHGVSRRRDWTRGLAGRVFAGCARYWLRVAVRDTQCGFKMFRREAGHSLFAEARETGYVFDLELLVLAQRRGYRVAEVPVNWSEIAGGHMSLARDSAKMFFGLLRLRRRLGPGTAAGKCGK